LRPPTAIGPCNGDRRVGGDDAVEEVAVVSVLIRHALSPPAASAFSPALCGGD